VPIPGLAVILYNLPVGGASQLNNDAHGVSEEECDAAERTVEAIWRRIGKLLDKFSAQECGNYFKNAGYRST